jgi:Holliday junction DNA helicase RuvA
MIAILKGMVTEKLAEQVVLDIHGVGYGLLVTSEDFGRLAVGQEHKVYVYEHIREQSHDLFGFIELDTKQLFEQLLGVNGVGPKMALNVLSIGSSNDVRSAIATGDVKFIQAANGVGKRVAERIIVELKDKVGLSSTDLQSSGLLQSDSFAMQDEATAALIALGYSTQDAIKALEKIDKDLPTDKRVKQALKTY